MWGIRGGGAFRAASTLAARAEGRLHRTNIESVELRRALLLFAIVLGLAAIVTSISRPTERAKRSDGSGDAVRPATPTANPGRDPLKAAQVSFSAAEPAARRLEVGRPATVTVKAAVPGQVEVEGLGLSAPAEPLTPARFEVLAARPGQHPVRFTPVGGGATRSAGTLRVVAPG